MSNASVNFDENITGNITDNMPDINGAKQPLNFCIIATSLAFYNLVTILMKQKSKLKKDYLIHFREGEELKKYNENMYSTLHKQHIKYITSVFCIVASLAFFYSYLVQRLFHLFLFVFIITSFISFFVYHFPQYTNNTILKYQQIWAKISRTRICADSTIQKLNSWLRKSEENKDKNTSPEKQ